MRVLAWLILGILVYWALRKAKPISRNRQDSASAVPHPGMGRFTRQPADKPAETMVSCAHCQIYVPLSEAVQKNGKSYCSAAHADLH